MRTERFAESTNYLYFLGVSLKRNTSLLRQS